MRALLACLGASLLVAACARPAPRRVAIATVRQPATSLLFVAQAGGCFARENLEVEEHRFELGRDAVGLLGEGGAELAITYETPFLAAARENPTLRVLTALHSSTRNTRLISPRSSGIDDVGDLGGKRIALAEGTNAEFFLEVALRYGGVAREAVQIVPLPPEQSIEALRAGAVDAAVLSDPPAARAEHALGAAAVTVRTDLYVEFSLLVTRAETIERRRPELEAVLRALACGERLASADPSQALTWLGERFPELSDAELKAQVENVTWGLGLDHLLLAVLRSETEWLHARLPGGSPRPSQLLAPRPLEAVDPELVMLMPAPAW